MGKNSAAILPYMGKNSAAVLGKHSAAVLHNLYCHYIAIIIWARTVQLYCHNGQAQCSCIAQSIIVPGSLCGRGALPRATPAKMSIAQFDIKIITIIIVINLIIIKP